VNTHCEILTYWRHQLWSTCRHLELAHAHQLGNVILAYVAYNSSGQ